jgi:dTDP-L-rhamnose 4-epimerase
LHGDTTCRSDWMGAIKRQDVVVHLAAETGTGQSMYRIEHYSKINIGGTALFLDLLTNTNHSISKVIVASSRAIYGEGKYFSKELGVIYPDHRKDEDMSKGYFEVKYPGCLLPLTLLPTDENSKIHPTSIYGITKQVQEQLVMTHTKAIGLAGVALRYQNVYGPGQSLSNPYTGILSIFSNRILNCKPINIFEDGKESRDFIFIDDVVDATILSIENENANGEAFNVGTNESIDVITVVNELMKNYGNDVPATISGNYRLGDIRHNKADLSKITSILGFVPKVRFSEGIMRFTEWARKQKIMNEGYDASLIELKKKGFLK